jgi:plastocyanin
MLSKDVIEWVKTGKSKGYSEVQLKGIMGSHGYNEAQIGNAFDAARKKTIEEKPKNKYLLLSAPLFLLILAAFSTVIIVNQGESISSELQNSSSLVGSRGDEFNRTDTDAEKEMKLASEEITDKEISDAALRYAEIKPATGVMHAITIYDFIGEPQNLNIQKGDTVRFINDQREKHTIGIRELVNGEFEKGAIDGYNTISTGDHYDYTFNGPGTYLWFSKGNFPRTSGEIRVFE